MTKYLSEKIILLLAIHILSASQTFDFSSDLPDPLSQMSVSSDCQCAEKVSCDEVRHSFYPSGKTQLSLLVIGFADRRTDRKD